MRCLPGPSRRGPIWASMSIFRHKMVPNAPAKLSTSEWRSRTSIATQWRRRNVPTQPMSARVDRLPRRLNHAGGIDLTSFLTDYGVVVALVCAGAAVLYGLIITQRLLAKSPGNERMQEISGAVQEGARAYLTRQYTIIAAVAVPLLVVLWLLQSYQTAIGFAIGGILSGAAGFIGMNLSVRANTRVAEAAR